jgi:hypothetical protein
MKNILYLVAVLFLINACTEKIELDLNTLDQKRLVVDGWITNEADSHKVDLSYTVDFFAEEAAEKVTNAVVSIFDGSTTVNLTQAKPGVYSSNAGYKGSVGKNYTLTIDIDGEQYTSTTYLDSVMTIDSLSYSKKDDFGRDLETGKNDLQLYRLLMTIKELPGKGDYYAIRTFKNGILDSDSLFEYVFFDDQFIDGYQYELASYDIVEAEIGDVFDIELLSISKEAYEAYQAMFSESFRGGIFDAPPANVPSNISNGALGIFNASAVSRGTFTITD